jgi:hypothetical protein
MVCFAPEPGLSLLVTDADAVPPMPGAFEWSAFAGSLMVGLIALISA